MSNTRTIAETRWVTAARFLLASAVLLVGASRTAEARLGADYFPNVALVNQDGETLHFYDDVIKGKVVAINLIYTHCGDSCPLETAKLRQVQKLLGDRVGRDIFMYSITIDPEHDTPAVLKEYMRRFQVGPGWQFLTGKKADIDLIRRKLGMFREDDDELSAHNVNLVVGNEATGQWMKRTPFDVPQVIASVLGERLHNYAKRPPAGRQSYASATRLPQAIQGENLFRSRCAACHSIGGGDKLGPDLRGVVDRRERAWLARFLKEPDVMLKEDPLAQALLARYNNVPMPNLKLGEVDIQGLIEYLRAETRRRSVAAGGGPKGEVRGGI